ncbi:MAG: hypothetical protein EOP45_08410 [Sphingobacteriaceae bacterium]|nr:MAG: hypothetical protein EOP45_08410 [Sphingobacteriaceae bacterium]
MYSHTGQASLDTVLFFRLMIISRLENLVSGRQLIGHCSLRLDILCFLGYDSQFLDLFYLAFSLHYTIQDSIQKKSRLISFVHSSIYN